MHKYKCYQIMHYNLNMMNSTMEIHYNLTLNSFMACACFCYWKVITLKMMYEVSISVCVSCNGNEMKFPYNVTFIDILHDLQNII